MDFNDSQKSFGDEKKLLRAKKSKRRIKNLISINNKTTKKSSYKYIRNDKDLNNNNKWFKVVGKTYFLFMDKNENPLIIIGPHWLLFLFCFLSVNILYIIIYLKLWSKFSFRTKIIHQIGYWIFNLSYAYTSLINPGYPKHRKKIANSVDDYYFCNICNFYVKRSTNALHCDDCDICIENQDHHCPWTSHCIGKNNAITFYIFIIAMIFSVIYIPLMLKNF